MSLIPLSGKPLGCFSFSQADKEHVEAVCPCIHTIHIYKRTWGLCYLGYCTEAISLDVVIGRCCVLQAEVSQETSTLSTHKKFIGMMTACLRIGVYTYTCTASN